MSDDKDSGGGGSWYKVPVWDGSPQTFRAFKKEMAWWTQSLDLQSTKKFNLAARWLLRQTGIVRQRGEEFDPQDLAYKPAVVGTDPDDPSVEFTLEDEDLLYGINKLMRAFEEMNGKSALDKRGELRNQFYLELGRKAGERISDFCTRFRVMVGELKAEGVVLPPGELGWFLRTKLGLDPLREQLLETALAGREEYEVIEKEVLRLFKDLHAADPLFRKQEKGSMLQRFLGGHSRGGSSHPSSSTSSTASSFQRSSRSNVSSGGSRFGGFRKPPSAAPPRQAMATEIEENEMDDGIDEEGGEEEAPGPSVSLEEVLQSEAEVLATELEEAVQDGVDPEMIEDLEGSMETAAEALLSMREARNRISEVKKDRGYGRASSGPASPKRSAKTLAKKQSPDHRCWDCDQPGHWAGDPECKRPGQGLGRKGKGSSQSPQRPMKQVQIVEALETEHVDAPSANDVLMVQHLSRDASWADVVGQFHKEPTPKEINEVAVNLAKDKRLVGALDTACNRTCTGTGWLRSYLDHLALAPPHVRKLVEKVEEKEVFRFGNGGTQISHERWKLPAVIDGTLVCFWTSLVPVPSLGLLLGRDFLDALGTVMHFSKRLVRFEKIGQQCIPLRQLTAGHFMLPLPPEDGDWPGATAQNRWRKLGVDGVVELQLSAKSWLDSKLQMSSSKGSQSHEHMLTENSMSVGHAVCAIVNQKPSPVDLDQGVARMKLVAPSRVGSSTTSPTRTSTTSSTTSFEDDENKRTCGSGSSSGKSHRKMEQNGPQAAQKVPMARPRSSSVVGAKGLLALCALSIPLGFHMRGLDGAGKQDGFQGRLDVATSSRARCDHQCLHGGKSGRVHLAEEQSGHQSGFHGGSHFGWNAGGKGQQGHRSSSQKGSLCRSSETGSDSGCTRSTTRSGKGALGSKGWTSHSEEGFDQVGGIPGAARRREGHGGPAQECFEAFGNRYVQRQPQEEHKQQQFSSCGSSSKSDSDFSSKAPSSGRAISRSPSNYEPRTWTRTLSRGDGPSVSSFHGDGRGQFDTRDDREGEGGSYGCRSRLSLRATPGSSIRPGSNSLLDPRRDRKGHRPIGSMDLDPWTLDPEQQPSTQESSLDLNPWTLDSELKAGQGQLVAQAWLKHEADRVRISKSPKQILEVMEVDYFKEMKGHLNEIFVSSVDLDSNRLRHDGIFLSEVYTNSQRVMTEARKRGHRTGTPISLETGFDLLRPLDQKLALKTVEEEDPYALVLAFPCGPFSPLRNLNPHGDPEKRAQRLEEGRALLRFAIKLARHRHARGRHFILENPIPSAAWQEPDLRRLIEELHCSIAEFDQCRLGLRSARGLPHKKPTRLATSSPSVAEILDGRRCRRTHDHDPVLGGTHITARAGRYPGPLARAMVMGLEAQFDAEGKKPYEVNAAEAGEDAGQEDEAEGNGDEEGYESGFPGEMTDSEDELGGGETPVPKGMNITAAIKQSVRRLHESTGHRSNRRLARALALSGAPSEVVWAAKHHRCAVCQEKKAPKARRPASLPTPKECSDQVHIDLVEMYDSTGAKFMVVHMTDYSTRFQLADVLVDKSTKSVVQFIKRRWVPFFGPPRVLVADQGKEFVSWEMEEYCASASILLWHSAVQSPWQNGVAEKSGGILKTIVAAIVAANSVQGHDEMSDAVSEAVAAYNGDINDVGVSPFQAVIGRQPRPVGDVLGGSIQSRLAEHGLSEAPGPLARQLALRETAKVAITRLHFSRGLRRAELARSRSTTIVEAPKPGDICYFYRMTKYNNKTSPSKKKLALRRWHGPALVIALEGQTNAYLSFKGQLTKCSLEHIRQASSMEQIAASTWRDAIEEVVRAAQHDLTLEGMRARPSEPEQPPAAQLEGSQSVLPAVAPGTPGGLLGGLSAAPGASDLPPVRPEEVVASLRPEPEPGASTVVTSALPSRRESVELGSIPEEPTSRRDYSSRLAGALERAREADRVSGQKRPADTAVDDLERNAEAGTDEVILVDETPVPLCPPGSPGLGPDGGEALAVDVVPEHPLRQLQLEVDAEHRSGNVPEVLDHGSWDGRWPMPSRTTWLAKNRVGGLWPKGSADFECFVIGEHEVNVLLAARKEYKWGSMTPGQKELFRQAAMTGWEVWIENDAVEVLSPAEADEVKKRLRKDGEASKILQPRFVYTDKNDGLRTEDRPMEIKASARLVVPGYQDVSAYSIRKDAPTASRLMQHVLFALTASKFKQGWRLLSADVKSAFLKGDPYVEGSDGGRELYIQNVRHKGDEPSLPLGASGLARIKKGVFGLSDAPRQWYLRLHRALSERGWERSPMDFACWFLWSVDRTQLEGVVLSHVDDLLLGGSEKAKQQIVDLGKELKFGSLEENTFTYCGKKISQLPGGTIRVSMEEYHKNLQPVVIPTQRKRQPDAELMPSERKQLRAILGSLQWLVAQVRLDFGYQLSTLQSEKPVVATLLKANALVRRFKQSSDFGLMFHPMNLENAGIMVVTDAALGNVQADGSVGHNSSPMERVHSQAAYFVLLADAQLMKGEEGQFCVLDGRSHRIQRVCRSTFGSELLGTEEAFDIGQYCRGICACVKGMDMRRRDVDDCLNSVALSVVTDAKDVYDKGSSDTPTYGSQKALAFTVAWVRDVLRRPRTSLRWTSTENMFVDCGTKDMDQGHMQKILMAGKWSVKFRPDFVKQSSRARKPALVNDGEILVGRKMSPEDDAIYSYLHQLGERPGWHFKQNVAVHVAKNARSFRTPEPRFNAVKFPLRSSFARFDRSSGFSEWRQLEHMVEYGQLDQRKALIGEVAGTLVTFFYPQLDQQKKGSTEDAVIDQACGA